MIVEKREKLKTARRCEAFWDGDKKTNGRIGCGVVIPGVDSDKWITIHKIAVPLRMVAAMATEVVGVCVRAGIYWIQCW